MFVRPVGKLLLCLCFFYFIFFFFFSAFNNVKKMLKKTKTHKRSKIFTKNPEAVIRISGKRTIVYCRCTCHRHTLVFGSRKTGPPPIGAREINGLPKASMAELLVTKQDPNSCNRIW